MTCSRPLPVLALALLGAALLPGPDAFAQSRPRPATARPAPAPASTPAVADEEDEAPTGAGFAGHVPSAASADPRYAQLRPITWRSLNGREEVQARLYRDDGTLDPDTMQRLAHLLRDRETDEPSPLVPRTLQLIVRIATHFGADRIEIVSAYRTGRRRDGTVIRREGYHGVGSAIDFRLPGQDMGLVAAYARTLAHVGVGWYSRQGFVHLDSRDQSFFWESGGRGGSRRRAWNRPLDRSGAAERDARWTAEADTPWDPPGASYRLVAHVRTQPGVQRPRRQRHAQSRSHRQPQRRTPLRVFRGE
jgi:uncharacterized protein YcbK (DUF882 family)